MDEILDTAPCGFLSFADDGRVTMINATLLDMLGYQADEVTGQSIERLFTPGTRIFYQTHFFPLIRLHGHADEIFLMLRDARGADLGVLVNAVRRTRAGAIANDCVFIRVVERQKYEQELLQARRAADRARAEVEAQRDQLEEQTAELEAASEELQVLNDQLLERTHELERLRQEAEDANRAKSNFLAMMSHELRTPLNAIGGYTQLIEMGVQGPVNDQQRDSLQRIDQSQRHLLRLINEVLNLARVESGQVDYELTDVELASTVATDVAPLVMPQMQQKNLKLSIEVPEGLVVRADRNKMVQVILNLLSNAIKFTPVEGSIFIRAEKVSNAFVELSVRDTGVGIPPHMLSSIFEPFVQVEVHRAKRVEGTGLGLAISRDLARGMGGDLEASSEVDVGSTFVLTLPAASGA